MSCHINHPSFLQLEAKREKDVSCNIGAVLRRGYTGLGFVGVWPEDGGGGEGEAGWAMGGGGWEGLCAHRGICV